MQLVKRIFTPLMFFVAANTAFAVDFFGASIVDKEVPTTAWKVGITGVRPIITHVTLGSTAQRAGFKTGDIILAIGNSPTSSSSSLANFNDKKVSVKVLSGLTTKTLTIIATETTPVKSQVPNSDQLQDISPPSDNISQPLRFDDEALEKKYGKSSPAELERQREYSEKMEAEYKSRLDEAERRVISEKQRVENEKLTRIDCTGNIPGECGTGRVCVTNRYSNKRGVCKTIAEAENMKENQLERLRQMERDNNLRDINDSLHSIDRKLGPRF